MRNIVHSNVFIQLMLINKINFHLYKMEAGKNRVGSKRNKDRERKREADEGSERQSEGDNIKLHGLRNDHWKRHLSISNL
jgi:hypothetical protein